MHVNDDRGGGATFARIRSVTERAGIDNCPNGFLSMENWIHFECKSLDGKSCGSAISATRFSPFQSPIPISIKEQSRVLTTFAIFPSIDLHYWIVDVAKRICFRYFYLRILFRMFFIRLNFNLNFGIDFQNSEWLYQICVLNKQIIENGILLIFLTFSLW